MNRKFDKKKLKTYSIRERKSKSSLESIINPETVLVDSFKLSSSNQNQIGYVAEKIKKARENERQVIFAFGAHLIKNGLGLVLRKLIEEGYVTHLATNGAGSIHDWEFAFFGKTEENVRENVEEGKFGLWEETGRYLNLAIIQGAKRNLGYGESIGKLIYEEKLKNEKVPHPYKRYSVQEAAFSHKVPFTVHPCLGQDIIHVHPLCSFEAIGKTAEIDFMKYVDSIYKLEGGVYLSIGSAIMSPMIFEKALSMARNIAFQKNKKISDFLIVVNDIQNSGGWDWQTKKEPPKSSPAYYLRFCKTFSRMGARDLIYIQEDNRNFLLNLYFRLKK